MAHVAPGELITLLTTAVALGSDAMSLGIGLGMTRLSRKEISRVSFTIGLFHVVMPLFGMVIGLYLHNLMGDMAKTLGAILLIGLGAHMIWDAWMGEMNKPSLAFNRVAGWGLLLFAMSVSIDALSVGFSFGLSDAHLGVAVAIFGIVGGLMAAIGLSIGSLFGRVLGDSMEIIGGTILILFGIQFLV
jgi:putative Mn2+ efflux pump MntP